MGVKVDLNEALVSDCGVVSSWGGVGSQRAGGFEF